MSYVNVITCSALLLCLLACKPTERERNVSQSQIAELDSQILNLKNELETAKKDISDLHYLKKKLEVTTKDIDDLQRQLMESKNKAVKGAMDSAELARRDVIQKIYRELIKLNGATESGVTYLQYSERVLNAKTEVESAALAMDDKEIKRLYSRVLDAYQAARDFWNKFIVRATAYPGFDRYERERFKLYGIQFNTDGKVGKEGVHVIWENAQTKLKDLSEYLSSKGLL